MVAPEAMRHMNSAPELCTTQMLRVSFTATTVICTATSRMTFPHNNQLGRERIQHRGASQGRVHSRGMAASYTTKKWETIMTPGGHQDSACQPDVTNG